MQSEYCNGQNRMRLSLHNQRGPSGGAWNIIYEYRRTLEQNDFVSFTPLRIDNIILLLFFFIIGPISYGSSVL